mmetsp:Transcript_6538/g.18517  ORF Transcript_6538/g.18517 Transcript_6538/m.18517 type:complete len:786 (+) Transcript_6538:26-2383(+)
MTRETPPALAGSIRSSPPWREYESQSGKRRRVMENNGESQADQSASWLDLVLTPMRSLVAPFLTPSVNRSLVQRGRQAPRTHYISRTCRQTSARPATLDQDVEPEGHGAHPASGTRAWLAEGGLVERRTGGELGGLVRTPARAPRESGKSVTPYVEGERPIPSSALRARGRPSRLLTTLQREKEHVLFARRLDREAAAVGVAPAAPAPRPSARTPGDILSIGRSMRRPAVDPIPPTETPMGQSVSVSWPALASGDEDGPPRTGTATEGDRGSPLAFAQRNRESRGPQRHAPLDPAEGGSPHGGDTSFPAVGCEEAREHDGGWRGVDRPRGDNRPWGGASGGSLSPVPGDGAVQQGKEGTVPKGGAFDRGIFTPFRMELATTDRPWTTRVYRDEENEENIVEETADRLVSSTKIFADGKAEPAEHLLDDPAAAGLRGSAEAPEEHALMAMAGPAGRAGEVFDTAASLREMRLLRERREREERMLREQKLLAEARSVHELLHEGKARRMEFRERISQRRREEELRLAAERAEFERLVKERAELRARERAKKTAGMGPPFFPPLSVDDEAEVKSLLTGSEGELIAKGENTTVHRRDLARVAGRNWLNDECINYYYELLSQRARECNMKCHLFNSFFYTIFQRGGYRRVRRWTSKAKIDIFELDKVIFPVHLGNHWCCAVINMREKRFEYYDSLGSPNSSCIQMMRTFVEEEHKARKGAPLDLSEWEEYQPQDIPHQENGYDCGIFSCMFADFSAQDAPFAFRQKHMNYLRKKIILEIGRQSLFGCNSK